MQLDKGGVAVATGWKVTKIDATNKIAVLDDGYEIKYDKCLIATGKFFLYPIKRKKKKKILITAFNLYLYFKVLRLKIFLYLNPLRMK